MTVFPTESEALCLDPLRAVSRVFGVFDMTRFQSLKLAVVGGLVSAGSAAMAAVPADITTAISTMKDDGVTVATAFVVAVIAVAAIKFLRSAK